MLKEVLHNKLPLAVEELKSLNKMAKESALSVFKKRFVGEYGDDYMRECLRRIKIKFGAIKVENEREGQRLCI